MDMQHQEDRESKTAPRTPGKWVWFLLSLMVLGSVLLYLYSAEDTVDVEKNTDTESAPVVSVEPISLRSQVAQIEVLAEINPQWSAEVRAEVSGRIVKVEDAALAGARVDNAEVLFEIDKTQYAADVASAELALAIAELKLLEAQNKTYISRRQFQRDGTEPKTDLALHLPQLNIAHLSVTSAERQLNAARSKHSQTTITAPFLGVVTDRLLVWANRLLQVTVLQKSWIRTILN
ncbi:hypothetical protein [Labrenzia sp. DG1229]|uniref:efflux RND transporter periplasmic adaptor subunit n=1 Tax=Labrenzia sp. DG1229 TaxID=681847 RepID=UPI00048AD5F7|nr:hypothetical protein [Labrenzia sp. DG1229]